MAALNLFLQLLLHFSKKLFGKKFNHLELLPLIFPFLFNKLQIFFQAAVWIFGWRVYVDVDLEPALVSMGYWVLLVFVWLQVPCNVGSQCLTLEIHLFVCFRLPEAQAKSESLGYLEPYGFSFHHTGVSNICVALWQWRNSPETAI